PSVQPVGERQEAQEDQQQAGDRPQQARPQFDQVIDQPRLAGLRPGVGQWSGRAHGAPRRAGGGSGSRTGSGLPGSSGTGVPGSGSRSGGVDGVGSSAGGGAGSGRCSVEAPRSMSLPASRTAAAVCSRLRRNSSSASSRSKIGRASCRERVGLGGTGSVRPS